MYRPPRIRVDPSYYMLDLTRFSLNSASPASFTYTVTMLPSRMIDATSLSMVGPLYSSLPLI